MKFGLNEDIDVFDVDWDDTKTSLARPGSRRAKKTYMYLFTYNNDNVKHIDIFSTVLNNPSKKDFIEELAAQLDEWILNSPLEDHDNQSETLSMPNSGHRFYIYKIPYDPTDCDILSEMCDTPNDEYDYDILSDAIDIAGESVNTFECDIHEIVIDIGTDYAEENDLPLWPVYCGGVDDDLWGDDYDNNELIPRDVAEDDVPGTKDAIEYVLDDLLNTPELSTMLEQKAAEIAEKIF